MATGQGTAIIDFGAFPGSNEASVAVTGQATIGATSNVEAYVMGDDTTSDHTASDHRYFVTFVGLTCGTPTVGDGFTIYARSTEKLQGTFKLHWVWADQG
jgi:hypothetical protein